MREWVNLENYLAEKSPHVCRGVQLPSWSLFASHLFSSGEKSNQRWVGLFVTKAYWNWFMLHWGRALKQRESKIAFTSNKLSTRALNFQDSHSRELLFNTFLGGASVPLMTSSSWRPPWPRPTPPTRRPSTARCERLPRWGGARGPWTRLQIRGRLSGGARGLPAGEIKNKLNLD